MRKVGQLLLAGTMVPAFVFTAVDVATCEPLIRLAAAACPPGQVGVPPKCQPAPQAPRQQQPPPPQQHQVQPPPPPQRQVQPPPPQQKIQPPPPQQRQVLPPPPQQHQVQPPPPQQRQVLPPPPQQQQIQPPPGQQRQVLPPPPQQQIQPPPGQQRQVMPPTPQQQQGQPQQGQQQQQQQQLLRQGQQQQHTPPPQPPRLPPPTAAQAQPIQKITTGPAALVPTTPQGQQIRHVDQLRTERKVVNEGNRTVITEGNRVIVREANGAALVRHDDIDRFRYGARDVRIERRGNNNVTNIILPNGQRVVTVVGPDGRIMRRSRFLPDGREILLFTGAAVVGAALFVALPPPVIRIPRERYIVDMETAPPEYIYDAFVAQPVEQVDAMYSIDQVLDSPSLRDMMPSVDIDTITFQLGSWEVAPEQVGRLQVIADAINRAITANPRTVFLIEGHTDATGNDVDNLSLSDRRAETVALILSQQFNVPAENMVSQGYGSQYLRVQTPGPERRNRRVTVRNVTPLLAQQDQQQQQQ